MNGIYPPVHGTKTNYEDLYQVSSNPVTGSTVVSSVPTFMPNLYGGQTETYYMPNTTVNPNTTSTYGNSIGFPLPSAGVVYNPPTAPVTESRDFTCVQCKQLGNYFSDLEVFRYQCACLAHQECVGSLRGDQDTPVRCRAHREHTYYELRERPYSRAEIDLSPKLRAWLLGYGKWYQAGKAVANMRTPITVELVNRNGITMRDMFNAGMTLKQIVYQLDITTLDELKTLKFGKRLFQDYKSLCPIRDFVILFKKNYHELQATGVSSFQFDMNDFRNLGISCAALRALQLSFEDLMEMGVQKKDVQRFYISKREAEKELCFHERFYSLLGMDQYVWRKKEVEREQESHRSRRPPKHYDPNTMMLVDNEEPLWELESDSESDEE